MKKFLVLMLSLVLVFSLASCKSKAEKEAELEAELNKMAEDFEKELEAELEEIEKEEAELEKELEEENQVEENEVEENEGTDNAGEIDYSLTGMELLEACAPLTSVNPFLGEHDVALQYTDNAYENGEVSNKTSIEVYVSGKNVSVAMSDYNEYNLVTDNFDENITWVVNGESEDSLVGNVSVPDDPYKAVNTIEDFYLTFDPERDATDDTVAQVIDVSGFKYLSITEPLEDGSIEVLYSLPEGIFSAIFEYDEEGDPKHDFVLDAYDTYNDYSDYVLEPEGVEWID